MSAIVDTALDLFGTQGVKATSIAAVAARVGMTDAGVLHHFPTKAQLVTAALERSLELQLDALRDFIAPGGLEALRRFGDWGQVVQEAPRLTAFSVLVSADAVLEDSEVRAWVLRRYDSVVGLASGLIREGIERGEVRPDVDVDWEGRALIAYLDGIRLQWFYTDRRLALAEHVRRYVDELVTRIAAAD